MKGSSDEHKVTFNSNVNVQQDAIQDVDTPTIMEQANKSKHSEVRHQDEGEANASEDNDENISSTPPANKSLSALSKRASELNDNKQQSRMSTSMAHSDANNQL